MDFDLPGEDDPRRLEIREWFEQNPNPSYKQIAERGLAGAMGAECGPGTAVHH